MKLHVTKELDEDHDPFSALGRAVWDETYNVIGNRNISLTLSVLSVEPYGMKPLAKMTPHSVLLLSVLSVEPYGMKPRH